MDAKPERALKTWLEHTTNKYPPQKYVRGMYLLITPGWAWLDLTLQYQEGPWAAGWWAPAGPNSRSRPPRTPLAWSSLSWGQASQHSLTWPTVPGGPSPDSPLLPSLESWALHLCGFHLLLDVSTECNLAVYSPHDYSTWVLKHPLKRRTSNADSEIPLNKIPLFSDTHFIITEYINIYTGRSHLWKSLIPSAGWT